MRQDLLISLIDEDFRRRATISHCLSAGQVHVEPLENPAELIRRWPRSGMILAHDDGDTLPALLAHVTRSGEWLPVIAYAQAPAPQVVVDAVLDGAIGYLAWPFAQGELDAAIAAAEHRSQRFGKAALRQAVARSRVDRLTRREREVLNGVASGLSNRLIGERLAISPRTVEIHRANMLTKMEVSHTSEAIRIAIEASLVA